MNADADATFLVLSRPRRRPKGVMFITLEDRSDTANPPHDLTRTCVSAADSTPIHTLLLLIVSLFNAQKFPVQYRREFGQKCRSGRQI